MQKGIMWTLIIVAVVLVAVVVVMVTSSPGNIYNNAGNNQAGTNPGSGTSAPSESTNLGAGNTTSTGQGAQTHNINIQSFSFTPQALTINAGDTVIWTNMDNVAHTVTSDLGTELHSAQLSPGQSYSHTFTTAGTYAYHCSIHTMMTGTITVQ